MRRNKKERQCHIYGLSSPEDTKEEMYVTFFLLNGSVSVIYFKFQQ